METIACSCGGENPNCFKCDGTGLVSKISDQVGRPKTDLAKLAKAKQLQKREVRIVRRKLPPKAEMPLPRDVTAPPSKQVNHEVQKPDFRPYKKCPHCGEIILANRLGAHMDKVHASESRLPVSSETFLRPDRKAGSQQLKAEEGNSSLQCDTNARLDNDWFDGKFGWGTAYRDHGQFGSYPAHDDMDDESSP